MAVKIRNSLYKWLDTEFQPNPVKHFPFPPLPIVTDPSGPPSPTPQQRGPAPTDCVDRRHTGSGVQKPSSPPSKKKAPSTKGKKPPSKPDCADQSQAGSSSPSSSPSSMKEVSSTEGK